MTKPTRRPQRLGLYVTERCNLRCKFCFTQKYKNSETKHPDMTMEIIDRALELFGRFKHVMVGGPGEPMVHPCFPDIIDRLIGNVERVSITTNGTKTRHIKDAVLWEKLYRVNFSIPEIESERYKEVTGANLLEEAIWALSFLRENKATIVTTFVISVDNAHRIEEYVRFALDQGVPFMVLQPLVNYKDFIDDESFFWNHALVEENTEAMGVLHQQQRIVKNLTKGTNLKVNWPTIISRNFIGRGCNMALQYLAVNGNGDVAVCCRGEGPRAHLGNLRDGKKLWHAPVLEEFRRRVFNFEERFPKCKTCHAAYDHGEVDIRPLKEEELCP